MITLRKNYSINETELIGAKSIYRVDCFHRQNFNFSVRVYFREYDWKAELLDPNYTGVYYLKHELSLPELLQLIAKCNHIEQLKLY